MELTFTAVDEIPAKPTREGGPGAEPIKWEELLAPLKAPDKAGKPFLVWDYEKKTGAQSRISAVHNRLVANVPEEKWTLVNRPVPGSDPEKHGVYVQFDGTYTPEEVLANATKRKERSDRIKAARKAAEDARAKVAAEGETPATPEAPKAANGSAAERVAKAKAAASK